MRIIAEIGTAHRGSLKQAEKLIRRAAESGADCAKFQIVFAREILHPRTGLVNLPGGATPLYSVFESLEQDESFYRDLKSMTEAAGLDFLASPFGPESAGILKSLNPREVKIASPEVNYTALLEEVARWKIPVILSSGVSLLGDLEEALSILDPEDVTLLHCITSYPAPEEEYNLAVLPHLKGLLGVPVGVSDHSSDPRLVPGTAVLQGACMIEKHFTLSRELDGLDDPIALEPGDFRIMSDYIRELESLGDREKQRERLNRDFGQQRVAAVLGTGRKILAPAEAACYGRTNRSVHALTDLPAGTVLTEDNTAVLRTESVLRPGMPPRLYSGVLGAVVREPVPAGEGIRLEDLMEFE